MQNKSPMVGRKVPRSSYERDRRAILKLVHKLRKIRPAKGGKERGSPRQVRKLAPSPRRPWRYGER